MCIRDRFDPWTSDKQARSSLFYAIFQCYQNYLQQDPNSVNANDVTAILEALDRVDFNALGPVSYTHLGFTKSPESASSNVSGSSVSPIRSVVIGSFGNVSSTVS